MPLCRIKSDFATKHGITTKPPARKSRPTLTSALLRPRTTERSDLIDDNDSIKADDGASLLSILRSRTVPRKQEPIR